MFFLEIFVLISLLLFLRNFFSANKSEILVTKLPSVEPLTVGLVLPITE